MCTSVICIALNNCNEWVPLGGCIRVSSVWLVALINSVCGCH